MSPLRLLLATTAMASVMASSTTSGTYVLGPNYAVDPVLADADTHVPQGHLYAFEMPLRDSAFYDCTAATNSSTHPPRGGKCLDARTITVYIPPQYKDGDEAAVLVQQDGPGYTSLLIPIMDKLINHPNPRRALPVFISIAVGDGTKGDGTGSLRDVQYDTMSGKYASFVDTEVFAAVRADAGIAKDFPALKLTADPDGRLIMGCSSGAMAAFTAAWFRPDLFHRVVAYSAMLVRKDCALPSSATFPHGGWTYGEALIRSSPKKPLRIFHNAQNRDLGTSTAAPYKACAVNSTTGEQHVITTSDGCFSSPGVCKGTAGEGRFWFENRDEPNFYWCDPKRSNAPLANNMTATALQEMGYETRYAYALDRCHCSSDVILQDLPNTLVWAWDGWQPHEDEDRSGEAPAVPLRPKTALEPCTTCRGPVWTWDTFPAFFHGSSSDNLTDSEVSLLSSFPIVTLKKWQGSQSSTRTEEDAWLDAAKRIKAANPATSVIVWLDSFRIYTADTALNPDLKRPCTTGHFGPAEWLETGGRMDGRGDPQSPYLLKNTSGLPALESWSGCHIFDHTTALARDFWTGMCLNLTRSGVIDGCGADASWQDGLVQRANWDLDAATAQAWSVGHKKMMRDTTALLRDGVLLGKEAYEVGDYVNGALCESCPASNDTINKLMNLTATAARLGQRLIYECHTKHASLDEVAAFLCGAGPYQYYGVGSWHDGITREKHWMDGVFGRKLGKPNGDAVYDSATSTWRRSFASGTKVTFDAKSNHGSIVWGSS